MMDGAIGRRQFLKQAAAGAAVGLTFSNNRVFGRVAGANDRVRLGIIGAGARGKELMGEFLTVPNIEFVAAADVYTTRHDEAKKLAPGMKSFDDRSEEHTSELQSPM